MIRSFLSTFPCSHGRERQASSEICVSLELSIISGLMRRVSQRKSLSADFQLGIFFRWVVAIMAKFFHIWGAASPTPSYSRIRSIKIAANSKISGVIFVIFSPHALKIGFSFQVSRG